MIEFANRKITPSDIDLINRRISDMDKRINKKGFLSSESLSYYLLRSPQTMQVTEFTCINFFCICLEFCHRLVGWSKMFT